MHRAEFLDATVDVVVAVDFDSDVFDFGAFFEVVGGAFDFQALGEDHVVTVMEFVAVGIEYFLCVASIFGIAVGGPFVSAIRADKQDAVFIGKFRRTEGAGRDGIHLGPWGCILGEILR